MQNLSAVFGNVQTVHMKVEAVDFVGLTGEELEPNVLFDGDVQVENNTVRWADTVTTTGAYRVTLTEADGGAVYENPYRPIRVEVESGTNMIVMPTIPQPAATSGTATTRLTQNPTAAIAPAAKACPAQTPPCLIKTRRLIMST